MSWDDFKMEVNDSKNPTFKGVGQRHFYAIFRIGKKYKIVDGSMKNTLNTIKGFQKHMEREMEVLNANKNIENEILIGDKNIYNLVKEYTKDIKLHKNNILARELLCTASPDFFKSLLPGQLEQWKEDNINFLKESFGTNILYSTLHKDEKTWHIHSLIVPRFTNKKGEYILSNTRYFDGVEKFREWQTNYALSMQKRFKSLNRGVKYSKAKHLTIKQYYSLINKNLDTKDLSQTIAKAKNNELLEIKIRAIEKTLEVYKNYSSKNERIKESVVLQSKELVKEIEKMKEDHEVYKDALSLLSQKYKIPQYIVKDIIKECEQINEKEL